MKHKPKPWAKFYKSTLWRNRRRDQLMREPLCVRCKAEGRTVTATVANHVTPHRGDWELFAQGKLESVCASHHNQDIQREEVHGYSDRIGLDGYPVDGRHPFNAQRATGEPVQADRPSDHLAPASTNARASRPRPSASDEPSDG